MYVFFVSRIGFVWPLELPIKLVHSVNNRLTYVYVTNGQNLQFVNSFDKYWTCIFVFDKLIEKDTRLTRSATNTVVAQNKIFKC